MSSGPSSALGQALRDEETRHEARTEAASCLIVAVIVLICYIIAVAVRPSSNPGMFRGFTLLTVVSVGLLGGLWAAVRAGWSSPILKYLNVTIQISLVSAVCLIDASLQGPVFALSSLGPAVYPLVIALTGLRLNPGLSIYAGIMAATQLFGIYAFVLRQGPGAEALDASGSLGWGVTWMKITVLLGVGLTAGLAARQFGRNTRRQVASALRALALHRLFGRYVSPSVAERVAQQPGLLKPQRVNAVILFGDLRGFTQFCTQHPPERVTTVLNRYFDAACRAIEAEGGTVNKFIGDGFLALFGVPVPLAQPEVAALQAAQAVLRSVPPLIESHELNLGLAISSGSVVAGEIGSDTRCEFTVIGDAVNRTSRLESLNATLRTRCLMTAEIAARLPPSLQARDRGVHLLKGMKEPVEVFELLEGSSPANGPRHPGPSDQGATAR